MTLPGEKKRTSWCPEPESIEEEDAVWQQEQETIIIERLCAQVTRKSPFRDMDWLILDRLLT